MQPQTLYNIGITLTVTGILITTIATALILTKNKKTARVRGGGAIIIGPIPIVFGTDKQSLKTILLLSIILTALLITLTILFHLLRT
jgi:uncharacterized protein (TIGR00304 family)